MPSSNLDHASANELGVASRFLAYALPIRSLSEAV
jgi:hypothetical protein